ncbi:hypothetical protein [Hyphomicrobium sp. LHD-15]|uniref:hypothetical protein n=1 Tax=Hyphomicrobium sp. LHD-15 TaxID=3072142 RepID=UPI00280CDC69|nr:hypothetical protein [Hyphomicrobium sp. LHD-15]MDQ8700540.1 hypothetical protein [Hyphomicrobium sp. LHD-15]
MTTSDPEPTSREPTAIKVHETVAYRVDTALYQQLPLALFLVLLGLTVLAFPAGNKFEHLLAAGILIAAGITWIAYALYRRAHPGKALITLTPSHLLFRIPMVKDIRIPWREITAVEVIDTSAFFPSLVRPRFLKFRNVTAIRVSRAFYDRNIHINSAFMRGPGWGNTFIVDDKSAKVALHHEAVGVPAEELRHGVETRWRAFGPPASTALAQEATRSPSSPAHGPSSEGGTLRSTWRTTKIAVLLVGILALLTNIAGLWQTSSQEKDRKEKDEWQAQIRKWEEDDRRSAEESRKRNEEWDAFWRRNQF